MLAAYLVIRSSKIRNESWYAGSTVSIAFSDLETARREAAKLARDYGIEHFVAVIDGVAHPAEKPPYGPEYGKAALERKNYEVRKEKPQLNLALKHLRDSLL